MSKNFRSRRRRHALTLVGLLASSLLVTTAWTHSGGTNADGCHTNRKTGDYHCHNAKPRQPGKQTYCHVLNGQKRCGYSRAACDDLRDQFGGSCQLQ